MKTMKACEITDLGYYWLRDNSLSRWLVVEATKWNGRMVLWFIGWPEFEEPDSREVMGPIAPPEVNPVSGTITVARLPGV